MRLTLMSFSVSTSVGRPLASCSSTVIPSRPPCHSGAVMTSSTTSQTFSSGASISTLALPPRFPITNLRRVADPLAQTLARSRAHRVEHQRFACPQERTLVCATHPSAIRPDAQAPRIDMSCRARSWHGERVRARGETRTSPWQTAKPLNPTPGTQAPRTLRKDQARRPDTHLRADRSPPDLLRQSNRLPQWDRCLICHPSPCRGQFPRRAGLPLAKRSPPPAGRCELTAAAAAAGRSCRAGAMPPPPDGDPPPADGVTPGPAAMPPPAAGAIPAPPEPQAGWNQAPDPTAAPMAPTDAVGAAQWDPPTEEHLTGEVVPAIDADAMPADDLAAAPSGPAGVEASSTVPGASAGRRRRSGGRSRRLARTGPASPGRAQDDVGARGGALRGRGHGRRAARGSRAGAQRRVQGQAQLPPQLDGDRVHAQAGDRPRGRLRRQRSRLLCRQPGCDARPIRDLGALGARAATLSGARQAQPRGAGARAGTRRLRGACQRPCPEGGHAELGVGRPHHISADPQRVASLLLPIGRRPRALPGRGLAAGLGLLRAVAEARPVAGHGAGQLHGRRLEQGARGRDAGIRGRNAGGCRGGADRRVRRMAA